MITSINVNPDTFESKVFFFNHLDLTPFTERVVPLFGPNGVGKSTLISAIESQSVEVVKDKPTHLYCYSNSRDNFKNRKPRSYMESFDPEYVSARFDAQRVSEGQSIIYSMFDLLDMLRNTKVFERIHGKDLLILLDEIDSGMSIDNIDITMRKIKNLVKMRSDLQVIFSFNSPRVLKHFSKVLSMYDGSVLEMHTDEDMLKEIKLHKKEFDKIRKTSKGRPKIYD